MSDNDKIEASVLFIGFLFLGMLCGGIAAIVALVSGAGLLSAFLIYSGTGVLVLGLGLVFAFFRTLSDEPTGHSIGAERQAA